MAVLRSADRQDARQPELAAREPMERTRILLDRLTWTRWRRAVRALATSEVGGRVKPLFAVLLALLFGINGLNVVSSYVGRDFMTAIDGTWTWQPIRTESAAP